MMSTLRRDSKCRDWKTCVLARRLRVGFVSLACAAVLLFAGGVQAAPPETSLSLIPGDAGIYASFLRNKQQYDAVAGSRWLARLKEMPAFQEMWSGLEKSWAEPGSPGAQFQAFREDPANKELMDLGLRLTYDEIFLYGDDQLADLYDVYQEANWAGSFAMYEALATGDFFATNPQAITARAWGEVLLKEKDRIAVPKLLIGFKIREDDIPIAEKQFERLSAVRDLLGLFRPDLKDRMRKVEVGGSSFWTMELEGTDLDWESMPFVALKDDPEFKPVVEKIQSLRLAFSVGVHKGYLLVSLADTNDYLADLGQGMLLRDRPEMAAARQLADKPLTSISFVSDKFQSAQTYLNPDDLNTLAARGKRLIERLPIDFGVKRQLQTDVDELNADLQPLCPEFGPAAGVSYLTDDGYESFAYNWTRFPNTTTLGEAVILEHVGQSPLLMFAGSTPFTVGGYEMFTKWLKKGQGYFEQFALPSMQPEQRAEYDTFVERFLPLALRFDMLTREKYLPALAEGQMAIVLDASLTDKQWAEVLPPADEPLRLVQPAVVATVKDGEAVAGYLEDYRRLVNDMLVQWTTFYPETAPRFLLPDPKVKQVAAGKIYSFPLGSQVDVSPRVAPNYGVSQKLVAASGAPEITESLLGESKLDLGALSKEIDEKTVAVIVINPAAAVDAILPWIHVGNQLAANDDEDTLKSIQISGELISSIRRLAVVTRLDGDVLVTHQTLHLSDVPK